MQKPRHVSVERWVVECLQQPQQGRDVGEQAPEQVADALGVARHLQQHLETTLGVDSRGALCNHVLTLEEINVACVRQVKIASKTQFKRFQKEMSPYLRRTLRASSFARSSS